jgi:hypothetical protein
LRSTKMSLMDKSIIKKLKAALPNLHVVTPDSPDYGKCLERSMKNTEKPAVCALPLSTLSSRHCI